MSYTDPIPTLLDLSSTPPDSAFTQDGVLVEKWSRLVPMPGGTWGVIYAPLRARALRIITGVTGTVCATLGRPPVAPAENVPFQGFSTGLGSLVMPIDNPVLVLTNLEPTVWGGASIEFFNTVDAPEIRAWLPRSS